jgi:cytochrome b561
MTQASVNARYSRSAIALHWVIALLIFATFPLGLYMHQLPLSPEKLEYFSYHKWIGVTVFVLAIARLAWRAFHPAPPLPPGMPRWEQRAAHAAHVLLYLLLFVVPLSGWLESSATGMQTVWFGVLPLPDVVPRNKALGEVLLTVHQSLNWLLAALVVGHVAAALRHHFRLRDDTLARMLPLVRAPRS